MEVGSQSWAVEESMDMRRPDEGREADNVPVGELVTKKPLTVIARGIRSLSLTAKLRLLEVKADESYPPAIKLAGDDSDNAVSYRHVVLPHDVLYDAPAVYP